MYGNRKDDLPPVNLPAIYGRTVSSIAFSNLLIIHQFTNQSNCDTNLVTCCLETSMKHWTEAFHYSLMKYQTQEVDKMSNRTNGEFNILI